MPPLKKINWKIKRFFDLFLCFLSMPVVLPLCAIVALLIKLENRGPVFYLQERYGKNGQIFQIFKFRTMVENADEQLEKYLKDNPRLREEWESVQKIHNDPRVTKLGRVLRKTSLDELPQIFNIIKGDMSLVGPRPILKNEIKKYDRYFDEYCQMLPGLTGLWQISGRTDTTYERRLACDHYYFHNWSMPLDIMILIRTVPAVLKGSGAY